MRSMVEGAQRTLVSDRQCQTANTTLIALATPFIPPRYGGEGGPSAAR
jgi:hypothetical protein